MTKETFLNKDIKIGEFVKSYAYKIIEFCKKNPEEFHNLKNADYSKKIFGIHFPFFHSVSQKDKVHVRYWINEYSLFDKNVRICSQWNINHWDKFILYLKQKNLISEVEYETEIIKSPKYQEISDLQDLKDQIFKVESHLQATLRNPNFISQLEDGLEICDDDKEFITSFGGRIDILAKDKNGKTVVIELKAGVAKQDSIGQILAYMGDFIGHDAQEVRGILIAADFDERAFLAAKNIPNLILRKYRINLKFSEVNSFES